ncbi:hypothetical protein AYX13_06599 [Cryptococcus neoformans]|nr:hypothetical protein AYX13_06599 [Cryptococcus neoformans var. grubii]
MFLGTNRCFLQVKGVRYWSLHPSTWTTLLSSFPALEKCGGLRLVPIQRMAQVYHRQTSISHPWLTSASTLGQFFHSSSIKAHISARRLVQGGGRMTAGAPARD